MLQRQLFRLHWSQRHPRPNVVVHGRAADQWSRRSPRRRSRGQRHRFDDTDQRLHNIGAGGSDNWTKGLEYQLWYEAQDTKQSRDTMFCGSETKWRWWCWWRRRRRSQLWPQMYFSVYLVSNLCFSVFLRHLFLRKIIPKCWCCFNFCEKFTCIDFWNRSLLASNL